MRRVAASRGIAGAIGRGLTWLAAIVGAGTALVGGLLATGSALDGAFDSALVPGAVAAAGCAVAWFCARRIRGTWRRMAKGEARIGLVLGRMRWIKWAAKLCLFGVLTLIPLIGAARGLRMGEPLTFLIVLAVACWPAALFLRTAAFGLAAESAGWVFRVGKAGLMHCAATGLVPWSAIQDITLERRGWSRSSDLETDWLVLRLQPNAHPLRTLRPVFWLWGSGGAVQVAPGHVYVNLDDVQGPAKEMLALVHRAAGRHGWNRTAVWARSMGFSGAVPA